MQVSNHKTTPWRLLSLVLCIVLPTTFQAQPHFYANESFSTADTLRGMLRPERSCYDVNFYDLTVDVYPDRQYIEGEVEIHFTTLTAFTRLQVDLFENMELVEARYENATLPFTRQNDAIFITFPLQAKGQKGILKLRYSGKPIVARTPPWDGGFVWKEDPAGKPWIGVACEGNGASLWWPNKDHLSDEPDSMAIRVSVPAKLVAVANGQLRKVESLGERKKYHWAVTYPINNYNVSLNIADYANWKETYTAEDGEKLELDYYVLKINETKAKAHFKQVHEVLACFEQYFGKYPFWEDGYALVETPYLGMEHQGAIAYGNQYMRGYLGTMIPKDMDWDYIIVHETGHEYFGNSISCNDHAEMWIHESFTTYMEALFIECKYSYEDAVRYLQSQRAYVENREPILGPMNVNWDRWSGSDHYYKGALMLHTLRSVIDNDELWFDLLKRLHEENRITNMTSAEVIAHFNQETELDLIPFFEQYLSYAKLPCLVYNIEESRRGITLSYMWETDLPSFNMPLKVGRPGNYTTIQPKVGEWQEVQLRNVSSKQFKVAKELFLVRSRPK